MDPYLIYRLSDLVYCIELLCGISGYDVSSICAHPGLFDRGLQVTGSLLLLILVCYYIVLCLRSYCEFLCVTGLFPVSLIQLVDFVGDYRHMLSVYHISSVMASGDSRPEADRSQSARG